MPLSDAARRKHPEISWRPITHLFWQRYPYKVETRYPARGFRPIPPSYTLARKSSLFDLIEIDRLRYQRIVATFRRACDRHTPNDRTLWKRLETEMSFHYYFVYRADMLRFVAGNVAKIRAVFEPAHETDVDRLLNTRHTYLRPTLFFDSYPYRVVFRAMPASVTEELDTWVAAVFGNCPQQAKYNAFGKRSLYLSNEDDILLTRLAFSQYMLRIERIILRSKQLNGCDAGAQAGGEGSDPPAHGI